MYSEEQVNLILTEHTKVINMMIEAQTMFVQNNQIRDTAFEQLSNSLKESNEIVRQLQITIRDMEDEFELLKNQVVQLRKDHTMVRNQVNNLTKSAHHSSQSMY